MSDVGVEMPHVSPHFRADGLCQCPCEDCTTRLTRFCVCLDCPCESDEQHRAGPDLEIWT